MLLTPSGLTSFEISSIQSTERSAWLSQRLSIQGLLSPDEPLGSESPQKSREVTSRIREEGRTEIGLAMSSSLTFNTLGQSAGEGPLNPPPKSEPGLPRPARPPSIGAAARHCPTSPSLQAGNPYPTTPTALILAFFLWPPLASLSPAPRSQPSPPTFPHLVLVLSRRGHWVLLLLHSGLLPLLSIGEAGGLRGACASGRGSLRGP